jgi:SPP1 gp7 family putative phage head morphogenesis protein
MLKSDNNHSMYLFRSQDYKDGIEKSSTYKFERDVSVFNIFRKQEERQVENITAREKELAAFLAGLFITRTETIKLEIIRGIKTNQISPQSRIFLTNNLDRLRNTAIITNSDRTELAQFFNELFKIAVDDSIRLARLRGLISNSVYNALVNNETSINVDRYVGNIVEKAVFYADNFARRILIPRIENKENLTEQYINDSFNENSYFNMLANSEVSKFYHLAYLEKLSQANVIFYRYDAVLDDKTTEICTSLNGNIYRVDTSLIGMRSYYSTSPEISTRVNPYIDKDTLQDAGIPVPGMYHPNCRSTLVGSDGSTITR